MILYIEYPSPLGTMLLAANANGLCGAYFEPHNHFAGTAGWQKTDLAACTALVPSPVPMSSGAAAMTPAHDHGRNAVPLEKSAAQASAVQAEKMRQLATLGETARQLDQYFARQRTTFDLPLAPQGTPFQCEVWQGLRRIPFGETWHYAQLAHEIARPRAVRAVGAANARNPLSIIVPCHRVIGRDGSLVGYAGGLERKQFLLALEHGEQSGLFA